MFCNDELKRTKKERAHSTGLAAHPSERAVVYINESNGQLRYPARNNEPIPERYSAQGFTRHELPNLRSLERLEKAYGVVSEAAHFEKGTSTRRVDE